MQLPSADTNPSAPDVSALRSHLIGLGWVDPASQIQGLSSPGAGNMNHTIRIHLQGHAAPTLILKQSVPYVAKYPDIPAPIDRDQSEAAFYQSIRTDPKLVAHCPSLLGHDQANHLLCFEDLGTGLDFTHLYPKDAAVAPSATQAFEPALTNLLAWLSQLHALPLPAINSVGMPDNKAMRALNHEHIFTLPFSANNGFAEFEEVAAWQAKLAKDSQVQSRIAALGALYLGATNTDLDCSTALLHGDFYPGSWLRASTKPEQAQVIDPEFGFVGPAEFDLGVFSAHLTFAGWSHAEQQKLLQSYQAPANFNTQVATDYAAVEIMRRLLGVAKLPMQAGATTQLKWLNDAAATLRQTA